jgi:serine/threonine protein kinase
MIKEDMDEGRGKFLPMMKLDVFDIFICNKHNLLFIGMKKFRVGKTIGEGSYGKVKLAKHVETNQYVAIKCINKVTLSSEEKCRINE